MTLCRPYHGSALLYYLYLLLTPVIPYVYLPDFVKMFVDYGSNGYQL